MKVVFWLLLAVSSLVCGCALRQPPLPPVSPVVEDETVAAPAWGELVFDESCSATEDATWAQQATDPRVLLRGAACAVFVAERAASGEDALAAAERGRSMADAAVARWPHSAAAHYLLAYATGLVAEHRPLQALELVPVIEREAQLAADLDAAIDNGGPERMLGELYLRAPGFPISIGDSALAVEHYRRAVALAPDHRANRLGLVEALLAEEQLPVACDELRALFSLLAPETPNGDWQRAIELQQRLCLQLQDR